MEAIFPLANIPKEGRGNQKKEKGVTKHLLLIEVKLKGSKNEHQRCKHHACQFPS
jgi:hypothetical protein